MVKIQDPSTLSWLELNVHVMSLNTQTACNMLFDRELAGKARIKYLLRIHSRMNKIRADAEREVIREQVKR